MERFIKNLARGAGAILRDGFRKRMKVTTKTHKTDFVTEYDLKVEKFIANRIIKKFPSHGIIGEENGFLTKKRKSFWLIDPLDGTHGFVKGIPQFSTTFSFVRNNTIEYGVIFDPMADELFFAKKSKGATLNGKTISVSNVVELESSNIAAYVPTRLSSSFGQTLGHFVYNRIIIPNNMWSDRTSSYALGCAYVAAGRFDIIFSKGLNPWDFSAGGLILKEAGGKVTDFEGKPYKWRSDEFVGANVSLHTQIFRILKRYKSELPKVQ